MYIYICIYQRQQAAHGRSSEQGGEVTYIQYIYLSVYIYIYMYIVYISG